MDVIFSRSSSEASAGSSRAPANKMPGVPGTVVRATAILALWALATMSGCGGADVPARGVIEANVGGWEFRRYQKVLDIEVTVPENPAVAHTASYVAEDAGGRSQLTTDLVVSAFVTRFEQAEGVDAAVVQLGRRLAREGGYRVEERNAAKGPALEVRGRGESWILWPSGAHVVKVGGRGRDSVPAEVVKAYARVYPSSLEAGAFAR